VIELVQKAVVEFNPYPSAVAVLRLALLPAGGKAVGALVAGRWLDERRDVVDAIHRTAAERGKRWTEVTLSTRLGGSASAAASHDAPRPPRRKTFFQAPRAFGSGGGVNGSSKGKSGSISEWAAGAGLSASPLDDLRHDDRGGDSDRVGLTATIGRDSTGSDASGGLSGLSGLRRVGSSLRG